ncbi:calcium/proton exchanger [Marasmius fiardii PR-910]|nr:calcium/proton exchanger [Marasmius fiardii PR-910]
MIGDQESKETIKQIPITNTRDSLKVIGLSSWFNLLLIFVPISWALHFASSVSDLVTFTCSLLAMIPLAKLLSFLTDRLSFRVGQTIAGLLNVTLGNAVELIISVVALRRCQIRLVQATLIGAILGDLLLVLGVSFIAGGIKFSEQTFASSVSQMNSSLLAISVVAVLLPTAYHLSISTGSTTRPPSDGDAILRLSYGAALILLCIYLAFMVFQLYSHTALYTCNGGTDMIKARMYPTEATEQSISKEFVSASTYIRSMHAKDVDLEAADTTSSREKDSVKDEDETVLRLNLWVLVSSLVAVTIVVSVTAEWLVDAVDEIVDKGHLGTEFVGIVLLSVVGNIGDLFTAVSMARKDKLDLSIAIAVGSSIQSALFMTPFLVLLGWIIGKPLTLLFDSYESITLFFSVLIVNYVVQDGKSNWLEGFLLSSLYALIAVTFFFYPGQDMTTLMQCR